jgi:hypothetical protein
VNKEANKKNWKIFESSLAQTRKLLGKEHPLQNHCQQVKSSNTDVMIFTCLG